jgi:hypothetical protein
MLHKVLTAHWWIMNEWNINVRYLQMVILRWKPHTIQLFKINSSQNMLPSKLCNGFTYPTHKLSPVAVIAEGSKIQESYERCPYQDGAHFWRVCSMQNFSTYTHKVCPLWTNGFSRNLILSDFTKTWRQI